MELNVQVEFFIFSLQNYQFSDISSSIQFFGEISLEFNNFPIAQKEGNFYIFLQFSQKSV